MSRVPGGSLFMTNESAQKPIHDEATAKSPIDTSLSFDEAVKTREFRWEYQRLAMLNLSKLNYWLTTLLILGCVGALVIAAGQKVIKDFCGRLGIDPLYTGFLAHVLPLMAFFSINTWYSFKINRKLRPQALYNLGYPICVNCSYDVRGQIEPRCPECGTAITPRRLIDPQHDRIKDTKKTSEYYRESGRIAKHDGSRTIYLLFVLTCVFLLLSTLTLISLVNPISVALMIILSALVWKFLRLRRRRSWQALYNLGFAICLKCGHDLRGNIEEISQQTDPRCPKCKKPVELP